MIKISNVSFSVQPYSKAIRNVALYGAKNNYWCRETKVKKLKTNNN